MPPYFPRKQCLTMSQYSIDHPSLPLPCACYSHKMYTSHTFDHFLYTLTPLGVVNNEGRTPLGEAVYYNKLEVVKYMITELGMDVNGGL